MKLKTHKATTKRVKITPAGKVLRVKTAKSHLLTHKSNPTKTDLEISRSDIKKVRKLIPYNN
jgi:large subunit ribosomal protein L35